MAILVLGGAGYIGSHTARALVETGRDVVVADNLETGFRAAVPAKARFYEGDIRDRAFLDQLFEAEQIEGVIHFAANSQVTACSCGCAVQYKFCSSCADDAPERRTRARKESTSPCVRQSASSSA